ncbi:hypothetical protein NPIL_232881 [Nephila pilipes]|uniref:Uncharacterized protein n=1 Tax=Nephila pilipes TaxID=299642 RepID=A0A8X6U734_NEPPI|nr:hypothetical protein NPIL_232881 [Nephila pilipes]
MWKDSIPWDRQVNLKFEFLKWFEELISLYMNMYEYFHYHTEICSHLVGPIFFEEENRYGDKNGHHPDRANDHPIHVLANESTNFSSISGYTRLCSTYSLGDNEGRVPVL